MEFTCDSPQLLKEAEKEVEKLQDIIWSLIKQSEKDGVIKQGEQL